MKKIVLFIFIRIKIKPNRWKKEHFNRNDHFLTKDIFVV